MKNKLLNRESKHYKVVLLIIVTLMSFLVLYFYAINNYRAQELDEIYFFIYIVLVFMTMVIRKIVVDIITLGYLSLILLYYFF